MVVEQALNVPFYLDWKFWSFAVSFTALLFSQLPPIHDLLRQAKLDVEAYSRVHLTHRVGNPTAQLHLIISNTGGREIKVKNITLQFRRGNEDQFVLPAQSYLQSPSDKDPVLFTSFRLKPKEEWTHIINFIHPVSRTDEKNYRAKEDTLKKDIYTKARAVIDDKDPSLVEGDQKNILPLMQDFNNRFRWQPGEYALALQIQTEPEKATLNRNYRITLFESDSQELHDYCDDYKYGFGIFLTSRHNGIILPLEKT